MINYNVSILGGGIAGLTTAIALQKRGISTTIYEASPKILAVGAGLGIGANAISALKSLGIEKEVIAKGKTINTFSIYDDKGKIITQTDFAEISTKPNLAIHRADLYQILLAQINPNSIHLDKRVKTIENSQTGVDIEFEDHSIHHCDFLIVADGIHSVARQKLNPNALVRYAGYTCWRAIIDYEENHNWSSSETWGKNGRFGIVPLNDNKIYWFACINGTHKDPKLSEYGISELLNQFVDYHAPIPQILLKTKNKHLIQNDIEDLQPLSQYVYGRVLLIGDAAHATTPNMGQGACQAIEDAAILAQHMKAEPNFEKAFKNFENARLKRTKWITTTSQKIGKMAQIENKFLIRLRNSSMRLLPATIQNRQLKKLNDINFSN